MEGWRQKVTTAKGHSYSYKSIEYIKVRRKSLGTTLAWTLGLGLATTAGITILLADVYSQIGPDDI